MMLTIDLMIFCGFTSALHIATRCLGWLQYIIMHRPRGLAEGGGGSGSCSARGNDLSVDRAPTAALKGAFTNVGGGSGDGDGADGGLAQGGDGPGGSGAHDSGPGGGLTSGAAAQA